MRVVGEFVEFEHRCSAPVDIGEHRGPVGSRLGRENRRDSFAQLGPVRRIKLSGDIDVVDPKGAKEIRVELGLDGADREEPPSAQG